MSAATATDTQLALKGITVDRGAGPVVRGVDIDIPPARSPP